MAFSDPPTPASNMTHVGSFFKRSALIGLDQRHQRFERHIVDVLQHTLHSLHASACD
jgi:hypothetical protein